MAARVFVVDDETASRGPGFRLLPTSIQVGLVDGRQTCQGLTVGGTIFAVPYLNRSVKAGFQSFQKRNRDYPDIQLLFVASPAISLPNPPRKIRDIEAKSNCLFSKPDDAGNAESVRSGPFATNTLLLSISTLAGACHYEELNGTSVSELTEWSDHTLPSPFATADSYS